MAWAEGARLSLGQAAEEGRPGARLNPDGSMKANRLYGVPASLALVRPPKLRSGSTPGQCGPWPPPAAHTAGILVCGLPCNDPWT